MSKDADTADKEINTASFEGDGVSGSVKLVSAVEPPKKHWVTPRVITSSMSHTASGPGAHPDGASASLSASLNHS